MSQSMDDLEAAFRADNPHIDWLTHDVTFTMDWPDKDVPPVFTAVGWTEKIDIEELVKARAAADWDGKRGRKRT